MQNKHIFETETKRKHYNLDGVIKKTVQLAASQIQSKRSYVVLNLTLTSLMTKK